MDYELILDTLTESVKSYRDMVDEMIEKSKSQSEKNMLAFSRNAYVNVLDEITSLKTKLIILGLDNTQQSIVKLNNQTELT